MNTEQIPPKGMEEPGSAYLPLSVWGIRGVIKGMVQSIGGGEVTAFTSEIEKSRVNAVSRAIKQARSLGANAIVGLDVETSDIGGESSFITLLSATGTAVVIEKE